VAQLLRLVARDDPVRRHHRPLMRALENAKHEAAWPSMSPMVRSALETKAMAGIEIAKRSLPVRERGSKQGQIDRGHRAPCIAPGAQIETHALVPDEPSRRLNRDDERVITKVVAGTRNTRFLRLVEQAIPQLTA
jgi:hypothetical protein